MNKTSYRDHVRINPECSQFKQQPVKTDHFHNQSYKPMKTCRDGLNAKPFIANRIFMENVEPSFTHLNEDMCKVNFTCQSNPTYNYLNPDGIGKSPYFVKTKEGKFTSIKADSRLIDVERGYNMQLNETPSQVIYDMFNDNVSGNPALNGYGKNYTDYSSVTGGQIRYYIDKDLAEPFFNPVYGMKSKSVGMVYKDPMDNNVPMYNKEWPIENIENGLSSINDTTKFRDDIISRQQRIHNSQKYELAYEKY